MAPNFSDDLPAPSGVKRFHTVHFTVASMQGGGRSGFADVSFYTPDNQDNYVTCLSPQGVVDLTSNLLSIVASMPTRPKIPVVSLGGKLQGEMTYGPTTKTYFGQNYDISVIQALGVLTIRANIIDNALIDLLCAITGLEHAIATAQYYATTNMKARLDSIKAVLEPSGIGGIKAEKILNAIDKTQSAANRRNDIVHARWSVRKGKFRAEIYTPARKKKISELTVTETFVIGICEAYYVAFTLIIAATQAIEQSRKAAFRAS